MQMEGLGKLKQLIHLIGSQTCNHVACRIVPQQTMLPYAPLMWHIIYNIYNYISSYSNTHFSIIGHSLCNALVFCFTVLSINSKIDNNMDFVRWFVTLLMINILQIKIKFKLDVL
jgi:hypothetical protein